jgi:hypothetical protein
VPRPDTEVHGPEGADILFPLGKRVRCAEKVAIAFTGIRYHLASILAAHWADFVAQCGQWIRPVVFENVRKVLSCRTPVLGCHVYECPRCGHTEVVPHSCKSRFCPTCGKSATDRWSLGVLNRLLDVPYHHLVLSLPWQLRVVILPDKHYPMIHYAGLFANRWKHRYLPLAESALGQADEPERQEGFPNWAERQEAFTGRNPLTCPLCNEPLLLVCILFGPWAQIQSSFRRAGKDSEIPGFLRAG